MEGKSSTLKVTLKDAEKITENRNSYTTLPIHPTLSISAPLSKYSFIFYLIPIFTQFPSTIFHCTNATSFNVPTLLKATRVCRVHIVIAVTQCSIYRQTTTYTCIPSRTIIGCANLPI